MKIKKVLKISQQNVNDKKSTRDDYTVRSMIRDLSKLEKILAAINENI